MKTELVYPMALYVLLMFIAAMHSFRLRVAAIKSGEVPMGFYKAQVGHTPPEPVIIAGRHYDNQFQVPILFFIACALHIQMGAAGVATVVLAWLFVATRLAHSWVFLGKNSIRQRLRFFAAGWLVVLALWVQLAYFAAM